MLRSSFARFGEFDSESCTVLKPRSVACWASDCVLAVSNLSSFSGAADSCLACASSGIYRADRFARGWFRVLPLVLISCLSKIFLADSFACSIFDSTILKAESLAGGSATGSAALITANLFFNSLMSFLVSYLWKTPSSDSLSSSSFSG